MNPAALDTYLVSGDTGAARWWHRQPTVVTVAEV
jgi:hypothetical protein